MRTTRIALVSSAGALELDEDLAPLAAVLGELGARADVAVWDDPDVDWSDFAAALVRSTWDYPLRRDEFLAWGERTAAATLLFNPPAVLAWNTDKRYLVELDAAGLPVVPTTWLGPGDALRLPEGRELVVKPAVSAGAKDTARYRTDEIDAAAEHAAALQLDGRIVMIQPYLHHVDEHGERGLVYIDGQFSHAFDKGPLLKPGFRLVEGLFAEEVIRPTTPSSAEQAVGDAVMEWVAARFGRLLYARVDLAGGPDGGPVILELELTEPSLFHGTDPPSARRLAGALLDRIPGARPIGHWGAP